MLTLDNHLVGVTADRPHPDGYRPDLPLDPSLVTEADRLVAAHDEGRAEGQADAEFDAEIAAEAEEVARAIVVRDLEARVKEAQEETAALRRQLEAKRA